MLHVITVLKFAYVFFFLWGRKAFKIHCTKDGDWKFAECVPVMCEPPHVKFMGLYQCTSGFQYNSECRLSCNDANNKSVSLQSILPDI